MLAQTLVPLVAVERAVEPFLSAVAARTAIPDGGRSVEERDARQGARAAGVGGHNRRARLRARAALLDVTTAPRSRRRAARLRAQRPRGGRCASRARAQRGRGARPRTTRSCSRCRRARGVRALARVGLARVGASSLALGGLVDWLGFYAPACAHAAAPWRRGRAARAARRAAPRRAARALGGAADARGGGGWRATIARAAALLGADPYLRRLVCTQLLLASRWSAPTRRCTQLDREFAASKATNGLATMLSIAGGLPFMWWHRDATRWLLARRGGGGGDGAADARRTAAAIHGAATLTAARFALHFCARSAAKRSCCSCCTAPPSRQLVRAVEAADLHAAAAADRHAAVDDDHEAPSRRAVARACARLRTPRSTRLTSPSARESATSSSARSTMRGARGHAT